MDTSKSFFKEWLSAGVELLLDTDELWKVVQAEDISKTSVNEVEEFHKQRHRRNYVRAVFAYIEGMCFLMKDYAIAVDDICVQSFGHQRIFTEDETQVMREEKGYLKFEANVKLTFKQFARLENSVHTVDFSTEDWRNLLQASRIRDRLMHPKKKTDLQISDKELALVRDSCLWFSKNLKESLRTYYESIPECQCEACQNW